MWRNVFVIIIFREEKYSRNRKYVPNSLLPRGRISAEQYYTVTVQSNICLGVVWYSTSVSCSLKIWLIIAKKWLTITDVEANQR